MTRTYRVTLTTGREVTRELPSDHRAAREMARSIAERNAAWYGSTWTARDGDAFTIADDQAAIADLTESGRRKGRQA